MAFRLRLAVNKSLAPALNFQRHHSRALLPAIFFDDPFRSPRGLISDFWRTPDPFDVFAPIPLKYRTQLACPFNEETHICNPKDGFQVCLNVAQFKPDEVNVKVIDNCVLVEAKHEERSEDGQSYVARQFTRRYFLPDEYSITDLVSKLSSDGILTVVAPPKQLDTDNARSIPIQKTGEPAAIEEKKTQADEDGKGENQPKAA